MKAYLIMMGIRMLEMYRILKPTGTLYLHCDDNASHYLKIMMDGIFGRDNFRNEIVWQRAVTSKGNLKKGLARDSDLILRYSKSNDFVWNPDAVTIPYDMEDLDEKTKRQYYYVEPGTGRLVSHTSITAQTQAPESHLTYEVMGITRTWRWAESRMLKEIEAGRVVQTRPGNVPRYKRYLDEQKGKTLNNIWVDIPNLTARNKERIGYPTQKPIALLERIIRASSNPGDMVLDPFCGCATTCIAAERLQRHWIGIDLSPKSFKLVKLRLKQHGIVKKVIHQKSNPKLYQQGRTCKHTLFGLQEGRCNGCQMLSAFRNMTIDHIVAKSKGSADTPDNLQLLCGACKLMKGNSTQDQLIQTLKNEGIFQ
jgi:site-specific DNA-methyltransferase (adenine-specific)